MDSMNQSRVGSRTTKHLYRMALVLTATFGLALSGYGQDPVLIYDTWSDSERTNPPPPTYADFTLQQSAWFGSSLSVPAAGDLRQTVGSSSAQICTYFSPGNPVTPVTLASGGELQLTWTFTMSGLNSSNTSQGVGLAVVNSTETILTTAGPPSSVPRVTADSQSIPGATYQGYAVYMNMGTALNNGNSFQLREWGTASAGNILAQQSNWSVLGNAIGKSSYGYANATQYTFTMTLTRDQVGQNSGNGITVVATMAGGNLGGTGSISSSYYDAAADAQVSGSTIYSNWSFDMFAFRPAASSAAAAQFDTSLFEIQYIIPEPSTLMLAGVGLGLMVAVIRRRHS